MVDGFVPVRNRTVKILPIDIGERTEIEIPLEGVVGFEIEMGVLVFVGLLEHRIFEVVTLAQSAVAVIVVVHPLIDGGGLLADGFQRGVRMKKSERGGESVVGDAVHAFVAIFVWNILDQPVDSILGVGGFVGRVGIVLVDLG